MPSRDHGPIRDARDQGLARDQGQRRISAVTIGLAAASVAGTLAVAATAYAKESDQPPRNAPATGSPGPDVSHTPGSAASPAPPPANQQPADNPQMQPPPGKVSGGSGSGRATSGGT